MSYAQLTQHLNRQAASEAPFTFDEVERVIGRPLPGSATRHQAWWANTRTHSHAHAWLDAGWRTARLNLPDRRVTFVRATEGRGGPAQGDDGKVLTIRLDDLPGATRRLLEEEAAKHGGDRAAAAVAMMRRAVVEQQRALLEQVRAGGVYSDVNSVDLIREDRDAR